MKLHKYYFYILLLNTCMAKTVVTLLAILRPYHDFKPLNGEHSILNRECGSAERCLARLPEGQPLFKLKQVSRTVAQFYSQGPFCKAAQEHRVRKSNGENVQGGFCFPTVCGSSNVLLSHALNFVPHCAWNFPGQL